MSAIIPVAVGAVCLAAGLAIGFWAAGLSPVAAPLPSEILLSEPGGLSGTVDIGILLPLTGTQSTHGEENTAAALLAIDDLNDYLWAVDAAWKLRGVVEDTATSPVVATEKLTTLNARGIGIVVGPETSGEVRAMKGYADSNGMLLFSPSSTAPSLAIAGDSVHRMIVDDTKQGPAIAAIADRANTEILIPVWRGDAWGDGLSESTRLSFESRGGTVDEGIRYNPETVEFSATMSVLAEKVEEYVSDSGADGVTVLLVAFAEVLPIMQTAANHDILDDVRWLGTDGNALEHKITDDPVTSTFASTVEFTTVQISASHNEIYEDVSERVGSQFGGRDPNGYVFTTYDATWVLGLSMLHADSADPADVKRAIPTVAAGHYGAIGSTRLNDAGDLAGANYDLWAMIDGEWTGAGMYILDSDTIVGGGA